MPHNLGLLEVQWKKPAGAADLFEVSFESPTSTTRSTPTRCWPAGGRLSLTPDDWQSVADSNRGQSSPSRCAAPSPRRRARSAPSTTVNLTIGAGRRRGRHLLFRAGAAPPARRSAPSCATRSATPAARHVAVLRAVERHPLRRLPRHHARRHQDGGHLRRRQRRRRHRESAEPRACCWPRPAATSGTSPATRPTATAWPPLDQGIAQDPRQLGRRGQRHRAADARQTASPATTRSHPDWSADGSHIVYVRVGAPDGISDWNFTAGSIVVVERHGHAACSATRRRLSTSAGQREQLLPVVLPRRKVGPLQPQQQATRTATWPPRPTWSRSTA